MTEETKTKVSRKVIIPFVAKMKEPMVTLQTLISDMPESGAKKSFSITLSAFEKKFNKFASNAIVIQGEVLTEEEKNFLAEFRKNKTPLEQKEENSFSPIVEQKKKTKKTK